LALYPVTHSREAGDAWLVSGAHAQRRGFELFTRHAQVTVAGAVALRALLNGSKDVAEGCSEIAQREAEADELTREVLTALRRTFITPFDRGDIKDLITSMDDAIDLRVREPRCLPL
jgi:uncharacterized protein